MYNFKGLIMKHLFNNNFINTSSINKVSWLTNQYRRVTEFIYIYKCAYDF